MLGSKRDNGHKEQTFGLSGRRNGRGIIALKHTLPYVKQTARGSLIYDSGHPKPVLGDNLEGWGGREAGGLQDVGDTCMPAANSY